MRLGLIIYGSLDTLSGGYFYDRQLVSYLKSRGDEVQLISLPWRYYLAHLGDNFNSRLLKELTFWEGDVLLQDELNHPSLFWLNRMLKRRVKFPIISIVHHLRSSERHQKWLKRLYALVERAYLRTVDAFVFNSYTTRQSVEQLSGMSCRGIVAYPAGDRFGSSITLEQIQQRCRQQGPLQIIFIGNITLRKGLHVLIEALGQLMDIEWRLHVVGRLNVEPKYFCGLEARLADLHLESRVYIHGETSDEKLSSLLRVAHVLVMPSSYEGFGIACLEGMGWGVPAVAFASGGVTEIIENHRSGVLLPMDDVAALADSLRRMQSDRALLEMLSLGARKRFDDFPSWEQTCEKIYSFLHTL